MDTFVDDASFTGEEYEDPRCQGCNQPIDDGSVVQFGDGIWHFECFRCSKCNNLVDCYSNLLLLHDGSPICEQCSYNCHICHQTIKDEAIMTGEEAYHAECFRCVQCLTRIDDLVFTQTSKGIFCTKCHETRKQQRQKRKEEKLRQQQHKEMEQVEKLLHQNSLGPDAHQKNRNSTIPPSLDINTSSYSRRLLPLEIWQPSLSSSSSSSSSKTRQVPARNVSNDHIDVNDNQLATTTNPSATIPPKQFSTELTTHELIELNNMLNAAIEGGLIDDNIPSPPPEKHGDLESSSKNDLCQELEYTKAKLLNMESKFGQLKDISRKALDELNGMQQHLLSETVARKEAEDKLTAVQHDLAFHQQLSIFGPADFMQYTKDELTRLHNLKAQLNQSVNDLRRQRDIIISEIERHRMSQWDRFSTAHQQQLLSLQHDTDHAKLGYTRLMKARDNIITEMIMLNTKNAELSSLNNDLSRRMTEREREALAVMAGTSFLADEPTVNTPSESNSGRQSLDNQLKQVVSPKLTAQRDIFNIASVAPPRRFKFRRNRSKRIGGEDNGTSNDDNLIGLPYDTNTPVVVEKSQEGQLRVGNHLFNYTKFMRPTKCDVCTDKIWRGTELKCQECLIVCHTKCVYRTLTCQRKSNVDSVNADGSPKGKGKEEIVTAQSYSNMSLFYNSICLVSMFGQDLVKQVQLEGTQIPLVVQKCIEAVEKRGMDYEGIYRKSGGVNQMRSIQQAFEQNEEVDLCNEDQWNDLCAVTSVLKQYFRDLPNPLFTSEHHQKWVDVIMTKDDKYQVDEFRKLLHVIPVEHYRTLKYLMQHLAKINSKNNENLMTAKNLAVVFGPTLMRHTDETQDMVVNHKIGCIEFILNHMEIFDGPVPELNKSAPLPVQKTSLPTRHRREASIGLPAPAMPPRENAGFI
ncbi:hypothetical protein BC941DRAFT_6029 [Chlamydoabsidia padenii]|nr:hypothetical protein BC941DRAFT_6029 [Chlamydoabsidia padenii]